MDTLITTALKRPYVVAFLISYIFIAIRVTNWRWTLNYLIAGYSIAFVSEYLSINYGIPYGWYFYRYENLKGEWLNNGVPVWDSVSYVFMCFAGLYAARFSLRHSDVTTPTDKLKLVFISAIFVTLLDIIIDPIAHLGKRWFLGEIYYYPNPGFYFDVTLANFAGWFLVGLVINSIGVFLLKFNNLCQLSAVNNKLALGLYYGIIGFGLAIALYLKETFLVLCDVGWVVGSVLLLCVGHKKNSLN